MRISYKQNKRRKSRFMFAAVAILALITLLVVWFDASTRPVIESIITYEAKVKASKMVNAAMMSELEALAPSYDTLVKVSRDDAGSVTSIETNIGEVNMLKGHIGESVTNSFGITNDNTIYVPIGNLLGNQFTSGRGPDIKIKVVPNGYVQTEILNKFSAAGINQTMHQIVLKVSVSMMAAMPGYSIKTDSVTEFPIAETIIVGKTPDTFVDFGGSVPTYKQIQN